VTRIPGAALADTPPVLRPIPHCKEFSSPIANSSPIKTNSLVRYVAFFAAAVPALVFLCLWTLRIDISKVQRSDAAVIFTDRNGLALGTVLPADRQHTVAVPLDRVSPTFVAAIIASEDARFFHHSGVDAVAAARAVRQLLTSGESASGASTITMQVARMFYNVPNSVSGKIAQVWLAWRIEAGSSKSVILEAYLNRLPMSGNIYGIEAASRSYFGISAAELDLAQASLLAAVPNDPVRLDPRAHWSELKKRQRYVLARMQQTGAVTDAQARQARSEQMHLVELSRGVIAGAHLIFALASHSAPHESRVRTTLDRPLQQFVESQMRSLLATLSARNVGQASALVVDNHSGDVLAYVGSADYFDDAKHGRNDGVQALRQPGSALKPFLYELALERGIIQPTTILADVPTTYAIPNRRLYAPTDYSSAYAGPVRVRVALANSLNVPAVRVLSQVGTPAFLGRLRELGFKHLDKSPDYYGLGLTLGGGEVSLWELTQAYLTMARAGRPTPLRTITDSASLWNAQVGSPRLWSLVTDMLSDAHARARSFGVASVLDLPFSTAVKTGTSSDFRDTWTVGFSNDYTVGVWVGNSDGTPMRHVSGVTGAAPLWNRIMLRRAQAREPSPFPPPAQLVRRPICSTTGVTPGADCPAVVWEYVFPSHLSANKKSALKYSKAYDGWLAAQNIAATNQEDVRILFPHQDDTFVLNRTDDNIQVAPRQAIQFVVRTIPHAPVIWRLNGNVVATTAENAMQWPLRLGRWRLDVKTATKWDSVTFRVLPSAPHALRGFSL